MKRAKLPPLQLKCLTWSFHWGYLRNGWGAGWADDCL